MRAASAHPMSVSTPEDASMPQSPESSNPPAPDEQPDEQPGEQPATKLDAKAVREQQKRARQAIAAATPQMPASQAPLALETQGSALEPHQLRGVIESLLFVAGRPLEVSELRRLTGADEARVRSAVA